MISSQHATLCNGDFRTHSDKVTSCNWVGWNGSFQMLTTFLRGGDSLRQVILCLGQQARHRARNLRRHRTKFSLHQWTVKSILNPKSLNLHSSTCALHAQIAHNLQFCDTCGTPAEQSSRQPPPPRGCRTSPRCWARTCHQCRL